MSFVNEFDEFCEWISKANAKALRLKSARMRHGARTFVTRPERTFVIVDLRYIFIPQTFRKIFEKIRTERSRQASRRIYQSGRDNLF